MKKVFLLVCFLIVYGSLYPFKLSLALPSTSDIAPLFHFNIFAAGLADAVSNIILFVPYGYFYAIGFTKTEGRKQLWPCLISAFVFGYVVQVAQLWASGRIPWGGDAALNTIGALLGYYLSRLFFINSKRLNQSLKPELMIALAIGIGLVIIKLAPFAPSMDLGILKENLKSLLLSPSIDWFWLYENTVSWLVAFYCLGLAGSKLVSRNNAIYLVACVLVLKCVIISNNVNFSQIVGGIAALGIWYASRRRLSEVLLVIALLFAVVANGYYPFEYRNNPVSFNWIPFTGSLGGNLLLNILAVTKKLLFYVAAVYLLSRITGKLIFSGIIVATIVLISELGQVYVPNSVAEITDAILVLFGTFIVMQFYAAPPSSSTVHKQAPNYKEAPASVRRPPNSIDYIAGLDGLRAIAALSVFIVHFQQFTAVSGSVGGIDFTRWMINGNTGVALFFALSGFLLSIPFWRGLEADKPVSMRNYFKNRLVRIVPLYYLCFVALLALKGFSGAEASFNNVMSHLLFLHNLKDKQVMSLNPPFWTLAVEMQFYVLLPLLFLLLRKVGYRSAQVFLPVFIVMWGGGFIFAMQLLETWGGWPLSFPLIWPFGVYASGPDSPAITYSLAGHLPHFLMGIFASSLFLSAKKRQHAIRNDVLFIVCCLLLILVLATNLDEYFYIDYGRYNFPVVPILLTLLVYLTPQSNWIKRILDLPVLKWLGIISYGLYIFHYPVQKGVKLFFERLGYSVSDQSWSFGFIALVITVSLASVSYIAFERPIIQYFKAGKNKTRTSKSTIEKEESVKISKNTSVDSAELGSTSIQAFMHKKALMVIAILVTICVVLFTQFISNKQTSIKQPGWALQNSEIIFDHHAHTNYSDGSLSIEDLVELSYFNGCDAMSVTDHSNYGETVSAAKLAKLETLREMYPGMLIFAGIEVDIPSYKGREHMNILPLPSIENEMLLNLSRILTTESNDIKTASDDIFFDALAQYSSSETPPQFISIYNHPSRKDKNLSENLKDYNEWKKSGFTLTAFSGAPGHQKDNPVGAYNTKFNTIDGWDPFVAEIGGGWDQLLANGERVWGALASSDYHNNIMDLPPCEYSRIHVNVPDKSYSGVLNAINAGTFWADHGNLLAKYQFTVEVGPKRQLAYPGAEVSLSGEDNIMLVNIALLRNKPYKNDFLRADIITNCENGSVTASSHYIPPESSSQQLLIAKNADVENCFIRSRVVFENTAGKNLAGYSNPVFISSH
ncbi:acyltransferase family protein [Alteromonas sp. 1_MG-2023]|uniref:acyltransferase family protein n=1 Tax=Alteromonas sp. 1_MG-2023 TaxID=3062669 RepID=UPI0026E26AB0|nr:acyltransferase family protein [Alteromonas sp. 1_MG-2023]MDO6566337.1 acyltransferase family protein [Alteromonas sp. 1_MG-2023]